jgi:hypothetical protein
VRALPVALTLMDQALARKHDTDLSNRLTDQAFGLLGRDAVLTRWHCAGIRGARGRVMAWPAAGDGVLAAGGLRGEEDEQA